MTTHRHLPQAAIRAHTHAHTHTHTQAAIKVYHKCKLSDLNCFQILREIRIHAGLDHKNIIHLVRRSFWAASRQLRHPE
jgi:hypothetical protein